MRVTGIYCPVVTPVADKKIALDNLIEILSDWSQTELDGFVVFGSTGEAALFDTAEKLSVIWKLKQSLPADKKLIMGTGLESGPLTIDFTRKAADSGADIALILTPFYYRNSIRDEGYIRYFMEVADASPIPVLVYNVTKFTGVNLSSEVVSRLSRHEKIVGIKESSDDIVQITERLNLIEENFSVLLGDVRIFLHGLMLGADGAILAALNFSLNHLLKVHHLFKQKKFGEAHHLFKEGLVAIQSVLKYGIPGIKAAMKLQGLPVGDVRVPLFPLEKNHVEKIAIAVEKLQI